MRVFVAVLLLLAAHFSLTAFAPGDHALFYGPWGSDTKSIVTGLGGLPRDNAIVTTLLAVIAGLSVLAALAALFSVIVPSTWFAPLVVIGAVASIVLFVLHFSLPGLVPILVDIALLFGVFIQQRNVTGLAQS